MEDYTNTDYVPVPWSANHASIRTVTINAGVTSIGYRAFYYCTSLTSVTIPDSVTSIGEYAFRQCKNLAGVTIPGGVTRIGNFAFYGCVSLQSITIPDSVTSIGEYAFATCASLASVTIGNNVTSIGKYAFDYCTSLTSVTIPDNVTSVGSAAFAECTNLVSISVGEQNRNYSSDAFGVLYDKTKSTLIQYPIGNPRTSFSIPGGVTSIDGEAFSHSENLLSVTIPDSVTSIGYRAFCYCTSLTSVTIGNSVTTIGEGAFDSCTSLTSVTIPDSVKTIGDRAFFVCTSLTFIHIPKTVSEIGSGCLAGSPAYICSDTADCYAKTYAEANGIEFRVCDGTHDQPAPQTNTLPQHPQSVPDVKAECDDAAFDVPVSLLAQSVAPSELTHEFPSYEFALTGESMEAVYLIRAVDENGDVVQPNAGHTVTLRIPIPAGKDYQKCRICHVVDAETARTESFKWNPRAGSAAKPFTVSEDGRYFIIEVTSFSPFIIFTLPTLKLGDTRKTLPYGEKRTLTADVENLLDGAKIVWAADNDRVELKTSADGKTCEISAQKNGKVTVTATVVDENGKPVEQDGETVSASVTLQTKANFFHKLWYWLIRTPWPFG